jgi:hypothetical protein
MRGYRYCYGRQVTRTLNFQWDIITKDSFVVITACEGDERVDEGVIVYTTNSPLRIIAEARFTVDSISPHNGGVSFHVTIDWPRPLILWIDIIVFDEIQFSHDGHSRI